MVDGAAERRRELGERRQRRVVEDGQRETSSRRSVGRGERRRVRPGKARRTWPHRIAFVQPPLFEHLLALFVRRCHAKSRTLISPERGRQVCRIPAARGAVLSMRCGAIRTTCCARRERPRQPLRRACSPIAAGRSSQRRADRRSAQRGAQFLVAPRRAGTPRRRTVVLAISQAARGVLEAPHPQSPRAGSDARWRAEALRRCSTDPRSSKKRPEISIRNGQSPRWRHLRRLLVVDLGRQAQQRSAAVAG